MFFVANLSLSIKMFPLARVLMLFLTGCARGRRCGWDKPLVGERMVILVQPEGPKLPF